MGHSAHIKAGYAVGMWKSILPAEHVMSQKPEDHFLITSVNKLILMCTRNSGMKYINEVEYCKSQNNMYYFII